MWTVLTIVFLRHVNSINHCVPETCGQYWLLCSWDMWTVFVIVFLRHVDSTDHCVPETCELCWSLCSWDMQTVSITVFMWHVNSVHHCVHETVNSVNHCVPKTQMNSGNYCVPETCKQCWSLCSSLCFCAQNPCMCVLGEGGRVFLQTLLFTPYHPHGSRAWQCGTVPVFWRSCEHVCPSPQQSSAILCRKTQTISLHMGWQRSPLWVYSAHKHSNKNTEQKTGDKCNCGNNIQTCSLRCNTVVRCFCFTVHCGQ